MLRYFLLGTTTGKLTVLSLFDVILVVIALLYEFCEVCIIHYAITINANASHRRIMYYAGIFYITFFYSSVTIFH
jgi:hypothetical protein